MLKDLDQKCCGCGACMDACPVHIIRMRKDDLGFGYPYIVDVEKCINCNRCNKVCPNQKEQKRVWNVGEVECAFSCNGELKKKCSSGGIFGEIASEFIQRGGVCFGAAFDENFLVKHVCVEREEELPKILGSKYVQSDTAGIYNQVKEKLDGGKKVLFAGTPCQIAALKLFLNKEYENLYLIDLFCYGVPSPAVWQAWLTYIREDRKICSINFRDKTEGWDNYSLKIVFENGEVYRKNKKEDGFLATFSKGCYVRESCLSCMHKGFDKVSDLTLGDFQELRELFPDIDGFEGVSMVRINSLKGQELYKRCCKRIQSVTVSEKDMNQCHPNIGQPTQAHPNREIFRKKLMEGYPIAELLKKYARVPVRIKMKNAIYLATKRMGVYDIIKKGIGRNG